MVAICWWWADWSVDLTASPPIALRVPALMAPDCGWPIARVEPRRLSILAALLRDTAELPFMVPTAHRPLTSVANSLGLVPFMRIIASFF
eukprot:scaffold49766_cov45-Phaeocystis_antarctica.AAC.1